MTGVAAADYATDVRLARLHLRTGATALARAELEWLAANGALDADAIADLALARWRTGDLEAAAEAAMAHIDAGGTSAGALIVAAESAAAGDHAEQASELVARVVADADGATIEALIAGCPTRAPWPADLVPTAADAGDPAARDPLRLSRLDLDAGRTDAAALRLGLALRRDPDLAAAVLETLGDRSTPSLDLVRGDALRALGREAEAERAFASAEADLDR
ncbi:MAG: hypothetical protein L0221_09115 [Chloroflexi bacterium]|nr:hypothetical protein [Chloroflexota bacterium]